jgi:hypothetical protein
MDMETGKPHLLARPKRCPFSELHEEASARGITCQELFQRAYRRANHPDSFARAVFARFMNTPSEGRRIPEIVAAYVRAHPAPACAPACMQHFCMGCMVVKSAEKALAGVYGDIHPESLRSDCLPERERLADLTVEQKLWLDLVESGALEQSDTWEDLHREEDNPVEEYE